MDTTDDVVVNKNAVKGQIKKAKLVCKGVAPRIKCSWEFEVQDS
jgi:hypothetical protein